MNGFAKWLDSAKTTKYQAVMSKLKYLKPKTKEF